MSNSDLLTIQGSVTENRIYYSYFRNRFTVGNRLAHGILARAEEIDSWMKCLNNCSCRPRKLLVEAEKLRLLTLRLHHTGSNLNPQKCPVVSSEFEIHRITGKNRKTEGLRTPGARKPGNCSSKRRCR